MPDHSPRTEADATPDERTLQVYRAITLWLRSEEAGRLTEAERAVLREACDATILRQPGHAVILADAVLLADDSMVRQQFGVDAGVYLPMLLRRLRPIETASGDPPDAPASPS